MLEDKKVENEQRHHWNTGCHTVPGNVGVIEEILLVGPHIRRAYGVIGYELWHIAVHV